MASRRGIARRGHRVWPLLLTLGLLSTPEQAGAFVHIGQGVASNWGTPEVGDPAVITWGFVPDGTTVDPNFRIDPWNFPNDVGVTGGSSVSSLRSLIDTNHGAGSFDAAIQSAFDTWSAAAQITFVQVADPGDPIAAPGSVTPDIRISAFTPLAGHSFVGTGAVGFGPPGFIVNPELDFPESGDIIFNLNGNSGGGVQTPFHIASGTEDVTPVDFFNFGDDLEGLFLHEVGHAAIGLAHPPWDGEDPDRRVMYVGGFPNPDAPPCCTAINRELHPDDIAGAQFVYGLPDGYLGGDFNEDGAVDAADYAFYRETVDDPGGPDLRADGDGDGDVDHDDYLLWRYQLGLSRSPATAIPEPTALATVIAALSVVATRFRPPA